LLAATPRFHSFEIVKGKGFIIENERLKIKKIAASCKKRGVSEEEV
jgi:hypothetical protein